MARLIKARRELAALLSFKSYSALVVSNRMAKVGCDGCIVALIVSVPFFFPSAFTTLLSTSPSPKTPEAVNEFLLSLSSRLQAISASEIKLLREKYASVDDSNTETAGVLGSDPMYPWDLPFYIGESN